MVKIDTSHVVKLSSDDNWDHWSMTIKLILESAKCWEQVDKVFVAPTTDPDVAKAAWDEKDVTARAIIVPTLSKLAATHVAACATAKEVWDKLKSVYADYSSVNRQYTLARFLNHKIPKGKSAVTAFMEMEHLTVSLSHMGLAQTDEAIMTKIVTSLPGNFNAFKVAWNNTRRHRRRCQICWSSSNTWSG